MKTETINLPNQVIDSDWKDDIDYEAYQDEKTYIRIDYGIEQALFHNLLTSCQE